MNYKYIYPLLDLDSVECPFALHGNCGTTCKHTDEECVLSKADYCEDMCNDYINCRIIDDKFLVKLMEMYNDVNEKLNDIHEKLKKMGEGKRVFPSQRTWTSTLSGNLRNGLERRKPACRNAQGR